MREKLQEYALIAEIIGGIAIVASLLFVGIQVNQNHDMMRAQTRNELSTGLTSVLSLLVSDPELVEIQVRANSKEELSAVEMVRIAVWSELTFRYWENVHYQYRQGLYDESEFSRHSDTMMSVINKNPSYKEYWCADRLLYSLPFMDFIDEKLKELNCLE